jgi:hypothetical protein
MRSGIVLLASVLALSATLAPQPSPYDILL